LSKPTTHTRPISLAIQSWQYGLARPHAEVWQWYSCRSTRLHMHVKGRRASDLSGDRRRMRDRSEAAGHASRRSAIARSAREPRETTTMLESICFPAIQRDVKKTARKQQENSHTEGDGKKQRNR
jgi:hypothetical protein